MRIQARQSKVKEHKAKTKRAKARQSETKRAKARKSEPKRNKTAHGKAQQRKAKANGAHAQAELSWNQAKRETADQHQNGLVETKRQGAAKASDKAKEGIADRTTPRDKVPTANEIPSNWK